MTTKSFVTGAVLVFGAAVSSYAQEHQHDAHGDVGRVTFPTSCAGAVQPDIERAVAMLHSFWYDQAEVAFGEIAKRDPECAIAHWGVAMTLYKPLWQSPSPAELQRGAAAAARAEAATHTSDRGVLQGSRNRSAQTARARVRSGHGRSPQGVSA